MPPLSNDPQLKALDKAARNFAQECSDLLNLTVANGVKFSAIRTNNSALIGVGLSKTCADSSPIPLRIGKGKPAVHLYVQHSYGYDSERVYLTMLKSTMALYTSAEMESDQLIVTYDYARETNTPNPEAHLHVYGERSDLDEIYLGTGRDSRQLRDLHLPVGGRRFRPTLEDIVEFAILEEMVQPRDDWTTVVEQGRQRWTSIQLKALVRRDQVTAAEQLRKEGWTCEAPDH